MVKAHIASSLRVLFSLVVQAVVDSPVSFLTFPSLYDLKIHKIVIADQHWKPPSIKEPLLTFSH